MTAKQPLLPSEFSRGGATLGTATSIPQVQPIRSRVELPGPTADGVVSTSSAQNLSRLTALLDSEDDESDSMPARPYSGDIVGNVPTSPSSVSNNAEVATIDVMNTQQQITCSTLESATVCRWKSCKRVDKTQGGSLLMCSRPEGDRKAHAACIVAMLSSFEAANSFNKPICGKRCYNVLAKLAKKTSEPLVAVKKRVFWHNDGPTPDVSSLSVLIDWLTDGNNYDRYRGDENQTGDIKISLAEQILRVISSKGIKITRTAKDITSKVSSLESSFRAAVDWLAATGQGVEDETSLRQSILTRCPEYYELYDTMNSGISTRAQLLNTDRQFQKEDTESEAECSSSEDETVSNEISVGAPATSSEKRTSSIPISIAQPQSKKHRTDDNFSQTALVKLKEAQMLHQREFQFAELDVRKKELGLREKELTAREKQLENEFLLATARIGKANAQATKLKAEAEHSCLQQKVMLLRERKKLKDEGISQDEIDLLLPLHPNFEQIGQ